MQFHPIEAHISHVYKLLKFVFFFYFKKTTKSKIFTVELTGMEALGVGGVSGIYRGDTLISNKKKL